MPDLPPILLIRDLSRGVNNVDDDAARAQLRARVDGLKQVADGWQAAGDCYFPGCENRSIERSHTVQRASMTQNLSSKVYTPVWTGERFEVSLRSPKQLSTFPGYCELHEKSFKFESAGAFRDWRDDVLQMMRTMHRELWITNRRIELLEQMEHVGGDLLIALGQSQSPNPLIMRKVESLVEAIAPFLRTQEVLLNRIRFTTESLELAATRGSDTTSGRVRARDLEVTRPYAFHAAVMLARPYEPLLAIALVFNGRRSRLITVIEPDFESEHTKYWGDHLSSDAQTERTLTEWLKAGTLDWYASADWWDSLSDDDKDRITERVNVINAA